MRGCATWIRTDAVLHRALSRLRSRAGAGPRDPCASIRRAGRRIPRSIRATPSLDCRRQRHSRARRGRSRTSRRRRLPRRSTGCARFDAGSTRSIRLPLTPDERVDRRILQGVIDGWLLDLDTVRTWTRNPMIYASAISDGVHNLMTMESSPAASRARQVDVQTGAACRGCSRPRARTFATRRGCSSSRAIVMFRGAADLLARDLPLAFADVADRAVQDGLTSAADDARAAPSTNTPRTSSRRCSRTRAMRTRSARPASRRGIAPRS